MASAVCRQWLAEAMALHQAGRLQDAAIRYRKVLAKEPGNFQVCLLAGTLHLQAGETAEGVALLKRAVVLDPGSAEAHANLGIAFRTQGQFDGAVSHLERAVALAPTQPQLQANLGAVLHGLGRMEDALRAYEGVLALTPGDMESHYQRGLILQTLGRNAEALASFEAALVGGEDPEVHYNRAVVLQTMGRTSDAIAAYRQALTLRPDFPAALNNLGNVLVETDAAEEGLELLHRCITLAPSFAEAHNNIALALMALENHAEALEHLDRAIGLQKDYVEAYLNKGTALLSLGRPDDALATLRIAEQLAPLEPKVQHNLGITLHALNRLNEALVCYRCARTLQPDYWEAAFHQSLTELLQGTLPEGWRNYELRWEIREAPPRRIATPPWIGTTPISGKRILLWCEQGLGDSIQFCRYVPLLANQGAHVILEVPAALASLAASLEGVETLVIQGDPLPDFDVHAPLLSLPLAMGTDLTNIPTQVPYLTADPGKIAAWRQRLNSSALNVGLVASGNPKHKNDRNRSLPLAAFAPLVIDGITAYLLQQECRPADEESLRLHPVIEDLRPWLTNFAETAAAIECLDLVITVDTSVAHLAGAMGKPVWILLPFNPDWRWLLKRNDCPWYPTAQLFRQSVVGNWEDVISDVQAALRALLDSR